MSDQTENQNSNFAKINNLRSKILALVNHPTYKKAQKIVWVGCVIWAGVIVAKSIPYYIYIAQGKTAAIEGRYVEAEDLLQLAVNETENDDKSDPLRANALNNLGEVLTKQGKYDKAELYYRKMLDIADHLDKKKQEQSLLIHNVSAFYRNKGDFNQALILSKKSQAIWETDVKKLTSPNYAAILAGLARIYKERGDYASSEPLYLKALNIRESSQGSMHPDVSAVLCSQAGLYREEGKFKDAESTYRRALAIDLANFGEDHPDTATDETGLAGTLRDMRRLKEAEPLYRKALNTRQRLLGQNHPETAKSLLGFAELRRLQGKNTEALAFANLALKVDKSVFGSDKHPGCADCYNSLSMIYRNLGQLNMAAVSNEKCLAVREALLPADHPDIAEALYSKGEILRSQNQIVDAERSFRAAQSIQAKSLDKEHPARLSTDKALAELGAKKRQELKASK